jgi:septum formation protein
MLIMLCGHTHQVLTAVSLVHMKKNFLLTSIQSTDVRFRIASAEEIDAYLETGEYQDKAGSYGIQGSALIFVDSIDGCYYNVVGLPVSETIGLFKAFAARKD